MRFVVFGVIILFVFLPMLLILFAPDRPVRARALWGALAGISPLVMIGLVQLLPRLTNNAPTAQQWERFIGLVLSGGGFVLPWVFFVLFLHQQKARPGREGR